MADTEPAVSGFVRLSTLIGDVQRALEQIKTDRAPQFNLKNGEVLMLCLLSDDPEGMSAEELSRVCHLDRSLISRSMRALGEKGFVRFSVRANGKREYGAKLGLTERGKAVAHVLALYAGDIQSYVDAGIPRENLRIMYETLAALCARFEELNRLTREKSVALYDPACLQGTGALASPPIAKSKQSK